MKKKRVGSFFFQIDPETGQRVDAPLLQEMVDDPAANRYSQETIYALALQWGMPEAEARELFLDNE